MHFHVLSTLSSYGCPHLWVVNKIEGIKGHLNMSRTARVVVPNYIYYTTKRENYRQNIFQDDEDRLRVIFPGFLSAGRDEYSKKYNLSLFAYCLMDNHRTLFKIIVMVVEQSP